MELFKKKNTTEVYTHLTNDKSLWFRLNDTYIYYNRVSNEYKIKTPQEFKADILKDEFQKEMWTKHMKKGFDLERALRTIIINIIEKGPS